MLDFLLDFNEHRNNRQYMKNKIKDLDAKLKMETYIIEKDPDKFILNIVHKNVEKIIVYRTTFDQEVTSGVFFIDLKIIHKKGIVMNRIRLSAIYTTEEKIELGDIEVFGENEGRGYGSLLLGSLINYARDNDIKEISGWISKADKDHFDKLEGFYRKHGFNVKWSNNSNNANKAAVIIWSNQFVEM